MCNKIDLVEKLKNCPRGTKLYSTVHGEVQLLEVKESNKYYPIIAVKNNVKQTFTKDGRLIVEHKGAECILFPSKDQKDWNKWKCHKPKEPKFDPKTLQPFDKVLVRDRNINKWSCNLFSNINNNYYECINNLMYRYAIPFNNDTKHLIGTIEKAPEYYRYWED